MRNSKLYRIIYLGILIIAVLYMCTSFSVNSTVVEESYYNEQEKIAFDSMDVGDGGVVTYELTMPEDMTGKSLEFASSHQLVQVYGDGALIYELKARGSIFGRTPGTMVHYVRVADPVKKVTVVFTPVYKKLLATNISFSIGYGTEDLRATMQENIPVAFICFCCVLVGLCCIFFYVFMGMRNERYIMILYFGLFVTLMGVWLLNESQFMGTVLTNRGAASVVSFLCLNLMPVPFILFHQKLLRTKDTFFGRLCCDYSVITLLVRLFLHITGILEFRMSNIPALIALGLCIIYVIVGTVSHIYNEGLDQVAALCIFAIVAYILTVGNNLLSFLEGVLQVDFAGRTILLVYVLYMLYVSGKQIYDQLQENERMNFYKKLAVTDIMTELRNRAAYEGWEESMQDYEDIMYVLFDLNDLKACNDNYGHNAGDSYIKSAAQIIKEVFGGIGECYRIGGDEFCVTIAHSSDMDVEEYIAQIREKEEAYNKDSTTIQIHMAVGYSTYRPYDESFERTRKRADQEMYKNKAKLKSIYGGSV